MSYWIFLYVWETGKTNTFIYSLSQKSFLAFSNYNFQKPIHTKYNIFASFYYLFKKTI